MMSRNWDTDCSLTFVPIHSTHLYSGGAWAEIISCPWCMKPLNHQPFMAEGLGSAKKKLSALHPTASARLRHLNLLEQLEMAESGDVAIGFEGLETGDGQKSYTIKFSSSDPEPEAEETGSPNKKSEEIGLIDRSESPSRKEDAEEVDAKKVSYLFLLLLVS